MELNIGDEIKAQAIAEWGLIGKNFFSKHEGVFKQYNPLADDGPLERKVIHIDKTNDKFTIYSSYNSGMMFRLTGFIEWMGSKGYTINGKLVVSGTKPNKLHIGDVVLLCGTKYIVGKNYLNSTKTDNLAVFRSLNIEGYRKHIASNLYGYVVTEGNWPHYKPNDLDGATKFVNFLTKCEYVKAKSAQWYEDIIVELEGNNISPVGFVMDIEDKYNELRGITKQVINQVSNINQQVNGKAIELHRTSATVSRGQTITGHSVQGRQCRTAIAVGHLSNKAVSTGENPRIDDSEDKLPF